MEKLETTKNKKVAKKSSTKSKNDPVYNLWVTDDNGELVTVIMKLEYKMSFITRFGLETIPSRESFEAWYVN